MKELKNKVAVITGAESGIGLALAIHCTQEGMKVVLADIAEKSLRRAQRRVKLIGSPNLAVLTDVSKAEDIETLAKIPFFNLELS